MGKALESRTYFLEEKQDGPETCHGARPPPRPCSPPQHIVHSHLLLLLEVHPSKSPIKTIQAGDIGWTFRRPQCPGLPHHGSTICHHSRGMLGACLPQPHRVRSGMGPTSWAEDLVLSAATELL